ncbi:uncharacterized protein LOC143288802 [Babylonia areolata]|uniref:uncharacterized protein LOC143288802 n=1 Tax=Babylonia areolata TaxID=304850 RepID=UPI003FD6AC45
MSDSETLRFIELVRSYPCIWDCSNPQYIDRSIAAECYISIAKAMGNGMTELDARKKMKSLRTQYRCNYVKYTEAQEINTSRVNKRTTLWKFFKPLDFLRPYTGLRDGINNPNPPPVQTPVLSDSNGFDSGIKTDSDSVDNNSIKTDNSVDYAIKTDNDGVDNGIKTDVSEHDRLGNEDICSDGSMSLNLSVDEEGGTDWEEEREEEVNDIVQNMQRPAQHRTTPPSQRNHSRFSGRRLVQNAGERHSNASVMMNSDLSTQRNCRKRKTAPAESAADILMGVTKKLLRGEAGTQEMSDNDHFFRMMALEVSRLPASSQDRLRYQIHGLLVEEKKQLYH